MAEIKSTMDLVMERAARMGKATSEEMEQEESQKKGMQLAADYLNKKIESLSQTLAEHPETQQTSLRKGMLDSLLRNIFLARDEDGTQRIQVALQGIVELGGGASDLVSIAGELQNITGQYSQHREQYREQLKEQVKMQIQQALMQKGMSPDGIDFDPTNEPQFQEEWARIEGELNSQYQQALQQYQQQLRLRLGIA